MQRLPPAFKRPVRASTIRHVDSRTILKGRAVSAIPVGGTVLNAPLGDLSFLVGAGSVYTTPRDIFAVTCSGLARLDGAKPSRQPAAKPAGEPAL